MDAPSDLLRSIGFVAEFEIIPFASDVTVIPFVLFLSSCSRKYHCLPLSLLKNSYVAAVIHF
ncbi:MAG TPA: hypothetical protein VGO47_09340, partial [Chlamydiales bacterium]|nr:hypothetical protein [Chlamydiales bacterium]